MTFSFKHSMEGAREARTVRRQEGRRPQGCEPDGWQAAALLRDAAGLGPARVVLRSCSGFMELFCDLAACELAGDWLTVRRPDAHLHVQLPALGGACLLEAGGDAYPHAPSLWLLGRCGRPSVIVILDRTAGGRRATQAAAFARLRARWGERIAFAPPGGGDQPRAQERVLH